MPTLSRQAASSTLPAVGTENEVFSRPQPTYVLISPVHNEEKFIGRMIESIASQTVLPGHWLIVDDGSTDRTPEIVRAYAKRYEFIELICLAKRMDRQPGGEGVIQQALK